MTKIRDRFDPGDRCPHCGAEFLACEECGGAMHPYRYAGDGKILPDRPEKTRCYHCRTGG